MIDRFGARRAAADGSSVAGEPSDGSRRQGATRARVALTPEGWGYLAILTLITAGAILREINLLIALSGLMLGPLLASWKLVRATLVGLEVRRRAPRAVHAGQPLAVEVCITNRRRRGDSWAIRVEDSCQMRVVSATKRSNLAAPRIGTTLFFPHVPAGQQRRLTYTGVLNQRGHYRWTAVRLETRVPFGLLRGTTRLLPSNEKLVVYPRLGTLTRRWHETQQGHPRGLATGQRRAGAVSGEFHGLRDWRSGDSRRWIHWRSSAKRAELLVKQFEQGKHHDLVVLLDLSTADPDRWSVHDAQSPLEKAVSFAATLVAYHVDRGQGRVAVVTAGSPVHLMSGPPSPALLRQVWELLAEVLPGPEAAFREALERLMPVVEPRSRLIAVHLEPQRAADPRTLTGLSSDPGRRTPWSDVIDVHAASPQIDEYLSFDQPDPAGQPASEPATGAPR